MCGITGFTAPGGEAEAILARMNRALAHRGPDGSGSFVDDGIALGHTRLAIIDLTGGAQPRVDRATGDAFVFNGEIYGYKALAEELRKTGVILRDRSDTEVLFQLIRRIGLPRAVERIDGMFAFAYRDGASGALHLVRDRFGEKPLYWGQARAGSSSPPRSRRCAATLTFTKPGSIGRPPIPYCCSSICQAPLQAGAGSRSSSPARF